MHGFNQVVNRKSYLYERIFWMILISLFTFYTCAICVKQIVRFINGPIVLTFENDYRNWVYEPVAITICTDYLHEPAIERTFNERFAGRANNTDLYEQYQKYVRNLVKLNANLEYVNDFKSTDLFDNFTGDDLMDIVVKLKHPIYWELWFHAVLTEAGICYSTMNILEYFNVTEFESLFNSALIHLIKKSDAPRKEKWTECRSIAECSVFINADTLPGHNVEIYFHGPNDILDMSRSLMIKTTFRTKWTVTIGLEEIVSSYRIRMFGHEHRGCRFSSEIISSHGYPFGAYTQNLCLVECRVEMAVQMCGCRPFFYAIQYGPICNISGMICLWDKNWREYWNQCSCLPLCDSVDYIFVTVDSSSSQRGRLLYVDTHVRKSRVKRDILFSIDFLVVSLGGAAALFLGCSFISIAEIVYFAAEHIRHKYSKEKNNQRK